MICAPASHPCWATACVVLAVGVLAGPASGCGKKGPPLAPFIRLPAAVEGFTARRLGSTAYVQFTIPVRNRDGSTPADLSRVDVYGYTGAPASDEEIVKYGTLVATVPVRRPPSPEEADRARRKDGRPQPARPAGNAAEQEPGFDQGATVTVSEALTPALMEPVAVPKRKKTEPPAARRAPILFPAASFTPIPSRVYVAVGVSRKGRRGAFSQHAAVPLLDVPAAPGGVKLSHTETAITIEWSGAPGVPLRTSQAGAAPVLPSRRIAPTGGPAWYYQVYEMPVPNRQGATSPASSSSAPALPVSLGMPEPLNQKPLTAATFSDTRIEFGTERCYAVRTLESFGTLQEESDTSPVACITPRDIYPPAAPTGLTAVVNPGVISLIWDPNGESDLDGYLILRAEATGGTLLAITGELIHETTFNDKGIRPGVRYVYAIVAVDKAGNRSAQSNRIEETAR